MAKLMTGISGIRGVVGDGLSPDIVTRYGAAFGTFLKGGKVVVGGDARPSRHMVRQALFSGLLATGCEVVDINLASTPTVELMVEYLKAAGGVCITASHNPISWNALKFIDHRGRFLGPEEGAEVNRIFNENGFNYVGSGNLGHMTKAAKSSDYHIQRILGCPLLDVPAIRRRQFRVGVDAVNSVGNLIMPSLLLELGCDVLKVHGELTGDFGREAEPLPENLQDLSLLVTDEGLDLGLALDPDGDRLAIVDEQGLPIGEELTLALAVKFVLENTPGPVVCNLSTSRAVEDIARAAGVEFYRTPVGEAHVAKEMDRVGAVIGGEGNGGVMLADVHSGRDAMVGSALVLAMLTSCGEPLSMIVSRLPQYEIIKRRAPAEEVSPEKIEPMLRKRFGDSAKFDTNDGVRVDLEEGWVHIRLSNTEPIVRIFAEARTTDEAEKLAEQAAGSLKG